MVSNQRSPTLGQAFDDIFYIKRADIRTSLPAQVINVASNRQSCDVQIVVRDKQPAANGVDSVKFPTIAGVRVGIMNGGGFFCSFPIAVGDFVWLQFAGQSIDRWLTQGGGDVDDPVVRFHDLADALAVPMVRPITSPIGDVNATMMVMGKDGGPLIAFDGSNVYAGSATATSPIALGDKTNTTLQQLQTAINTWVPTPNDGGAALKTALTAWLASTIDVQATKVKAV